MTVVVASFIAFMLAFVALGLLSARHKKSTTEDYLVASREVPAWLVALSSVATNNSGFMFIGLIGFAYRSGVQAVWLQAGWLVGDLAAWLWIHGRVRRVSGALGAVSVPGLLGTRDDGSVVRTTVVLSGLLTFFFLGGYAAAQLQAGSTTLHVLFGWDMSVGAILGAAIVVVYCFSGGLRASIWTDAAQAFVMLLSMGVLLVVALAHTGGVSGLFDALAAQDPALVDWLPSDLALGVGLYFLGFVFGGFGAVGQPHILIRSMSIRSPRRVARARAVYFAWFVPFSVAAVGAGLCARVLLPDIAAAPPDQLVHASEGALPALAVALLPNVLVGLVLAGVFSATMSTADSQFLSCSAALTQDVAPRWRGSYRAAKLGTLGVAALALVIALAADDGVFALVLIAWSALGAALGPLLVLRVFGRTVSGPVAAAMMASGVATIALWGGSPLADDVFKLLPGMAVPFAVYGLSRLLPQPTPATEEP